MLTIEGLKSLKCGVGKIKILPQHSCYNGYKDLVATFDSMDSSNAYWRWNGSDNSLCSISLYSYSMNSFIIVCNTCEQPNCPAMNPVTYG